MRAFLASSNAHKAEELAAGFAQDQRVWLDVVPSPIRVDAQEPYATFLANAVAKAAAYAVELHAQGSTQQPDSSTPSSHAQSKSLSDLTLVLADDSGLVVDALDGAPGVLSARFGTQGPQDGSQDAANIRTLLETLSDRGLATEEERPSARFVCVLVLLALGPSDAFGTDLGVKFGDESSEGAKSLFFSTKSLDVGTVLRDSELLPKQSRIEAAIPNGCVARAVVAFGTTEGKIAPVMRGNGGFGYDPVFISDDLGKTFGEASASEKLAVSHRGRAVEEMIDLLKTFADRESNI